ncbi:MAG: carboxypeptidase-like regulatory domain-containing protein [Flavobacteriaceae bacterium]|nr:carboxypeptidase-like regulatory domain-containing protein [Flavobacteriaceae bacterium]
MNKLVAICLYFCFGISLHAQFINGRVLDSKTHEPIVFANVYFNGTFKGTTTDTIGKFSIKFIPHQHLPLTVSFVGYLSSKINKYTADKPLTIYLKAKTYNLPTVEITSGKTKRKQKERIFKREFLGTNRTARYCIIENLNEVQLKYSKDKKTLNAFTKKPIVINNTYLGYKIDYYLDYFYYRNDTVFFQGAFYFKDKKVHDIAKLKTIKEHRKDVYYGSKMHFIRSLYNNVLKKEGYKVLGYNRYKFNYDSIMTHKKSHYINIKNHIKISYRGYQESNLFQLTDSIYITKNGYNHPYGIFWTGYMGSQRLGDLLPFEYNPDKD